jgi:SAM-dependent methyltransferase
VIELIDNWAPPRALHHNYDHMLVDTENWNSTAAYQVHLVRAGSRVLDVGCATGMLSTLLQARGCEVLGVDIDPTSVQLALERGVDAITVDITDPQSCDRILEHSGGLFDVVIFADVLEHVPNPDLLVRAARKLLHPSGVVLASLPNVAHGSIRIDLMNGQFRYRDAGLLDRTHIQLFDLTRVIDLFVDNSFEIDVMARVYADLDVEHRVELDTVDRALADRVEHDREAMTYQYVVQARPTALTARAKSDVPSVADVEIIVLGETTSSDWLDALPARMSYRLTHCAAMKDAHEYISTLAPDALVLLAPSGVVPQGNWVAPLILSAREGRPHGVGLADGAGTLVHFGRLDSGQERLRGLCWLGHPMLGANRHGSVLAAPFAAPAQALIAGDLRGTVLGGVVASLDHVVEEPMAEPEALTREGALVLLNAEGASPLISLEMRWRIRHMAERCLAIGLTPMVVLGDAGVSGSRASMRALELEGAVILGGDAQSDVSAEMAPILRRSMETWSELLGCDNVIDLRAPGPYELPSRFHALLVADRTDERAARSLAQLLLNTANVKLAIVVGDNATEYEAMGERADVIVELVGDSPMVRTAPAPTVHVLLPDRQPRPDDLSQLELVVCRDVELATALRDDGVSCCLASDDELTALVATAAAGGTVGALLRDGARAFEGGDVATAMEQFSEAVKRRPQWPHAQNSLGVVMYAVGELELARTFFERALSLAPGYEPALANLAEITGLTT